MTILLNIETTESRNICEGDSTIVFGNVVTGTGVFTETFVGQNGCDSVIVLDLFVETPGLLDTMVVETCDAFVVEKVYLCGITATPPHRDIQKTALGATESVAWEYAESCLDIVLELKSQGIRVVAIEQAEQNDCRKRCASRVAATPTGKPPKSRYRTCLDRLSFQDHPRIVCKLFRCRVAACRQFFHCFPANGFDFD